MNNYQKALLYSSPYLKITKDKVMKFGSNYLKSIGSDGKGGQIPDKDGFYTTILGALNIKNRAGEAYCWPLSKPAFSDESILRRKLSYNSLISEMDHPVRSDYKDEEEYDRRLGTYLNNRKCAIIKEVWLDETGSISKNIPSNLIWPNSVPVLIMGKVKPVGIFGGLLDEAFKDPDQNVFFSMRTISRRNRLTGALILDVLTGFDWVTEGGLIVSNSWLATASNSFKINESSIDSMKSFLDENSNSNNYLEDSSKEYFKEIVDLHGRSIEKNQEFHIKIQIQRPSYL